MLSSRTDSLCVLGASDTLNLRPSFGRDVREKVLRMFKEGRETIEFIEAHEPNSATVSPSKVCVVRVSAGSYGYASSGMWIDNSTTICDADP